MRRASADRDEEPEDLPDPYLHSNRRRDGSGGFVRQAADPVAARLAAHRTAAAAAAAAAAVGAVPATGAAKDETDSDDHLEEEEEGDPDPLLDDAADDEDVEWLAARVGRSRSDATLSCPGCLMQLCYACQRHERFPEQYRAVFVEAVRVVQRDEFAREEPDLLQVRCEACDTEVGAVDTDEVYHFFNVIASEPYS